MFIKECYEDVSKVCLIIGGMDFSFEEFSVKGFIISIHFHFRILFYFMGSQSCSYEAMTIGDSTF